MEDLADALPWIPFSGLPLFCFDLTLCALCPNALQDSAGRVIHRVLWDQFPPLEAFARMDWVGLSTWNFKGCTGWGRS